MRHFGRAARHDDGKASGFGIKVNELFGYRCYTIGNAYLHGVGEVLACNDHFVTTGAVAVIGGDGCDGGQGRVAGNK